ncbi:outer membrane biosynthesis protein TonB [Nocardioides sp. BE266]|uniref:hypothetical protein n=1 Tax=Nocardioides sp. BE266 TaxID=2817725 RepID=UPI00285C698A|nr:hypothetical protein [Nocardioides sp. BE266]MDR7254456.1 outer membrane biosynthesis protein TonB [Nocardioides sp. BE266]
MTGHDDDLSPWNDDPLVRALRAPGSDDELAGESEFLAAFRAAQPAAQTAHPSGRGRLRLVGRRLGGGGTAVVVAVALGAGAAAAAYTQNLPDPVQRAVHGVLGPVGVPAPEKPQADRTPSSPGSGSASPDREQSATEDPTTDPTTEAPTEKPSDDPTEKPSDSPSSDPSESPSPTETPSESPTSAPPVTPAAVSGAATSHRATPDESVAFSGTVTDAAGAAVAGQQVDLLQRQGPAWTPVATGTSDTSGTVSISAPALTRTSVFRLGIGDQLASEPWRVELVPTLTMARASGTSFVVTARGARAGDPVSLFSRRPGPDVLVARSRLAADLTATFQGPATRKPVTLVALLPRTRAHAVARTSLRVVPLTPTSMTASVPDTTPGPGDTVVVSGTVSSDGVALPGRQVWLMLREAGGEWRRLGSATSGDDGSVSIAAGQIDGNAGVRLRVGKLRSPVVRLKLQPEWSTTVTSGERSAVIGGRVLGARTGDRVLLRTVVDGVLTTVGESAVALDGSVRFQVPLPEKRQVRYRLVLQRTPTHLRAMTAVVVQAATR